MESIQSTHAGLTIDLESRTYFQETAKWSKFFGVLGFIFCGLFLLMALFFLAAGDTIFNELRTNDVTPTPSWLYRVLGFVYLVMSAIGIYVSLLLYRFGDRMITSLNTDQQHLFNSSVKSLRTVFRIYGIFMIIYLVFLVLAIIGGIIGGMLAA